MYNVQLVGIHVSLNDVCTVHKRCPWVQLVPSCPLAGQQSAGRGTGHRAGQRAPHLLKTGTVLALFCHFVTSSYKTLPTGYGCKYTRQGWKNAWTFFPFSLPPFCPSASSEACMSCKNTEHSKFALSKDQKSKLMSQAALVFLERSDVRECYIRTFQHRLLGHKYTNVIFAHHGGDVVWLQTAFI